MKVLALLLFLIPILSFGQDSEISKYSVGDELRLASRHWYTAMVVSTIGTGFTVLSLTSSDRDVVFLVAGGVLQLTGFIFMVESWSHIGKAGKLMNEKKIGLTFNNGIGFRYRI